MLYRVSARERATPADRSCDSDSAPVYRPYRKHLAGATSVAENIRLVVQTGSYIITAVAFRFNFFTLSIQVVTKMVSWLLVFGFNTQFEAITFLLFFLEFIFV